MGFTDPEAMLDTMTPEQWQHWQAVDCVEPIGNRGCEIILARIGELLAGFMGAEMRAADFAPWLAPSNGGKRTTSTGNGEAITWQARTAWSLT